MDLLMDSIYQRYISCIYMVAFIVSILFPCVSLLFLQIAFIPFFILTLITAVISCAFIGQILTIQKRE